MTPYTFLFLAVGSLGMLGVMHKLADHRRCRPEAVNAFLFLGAAVAILAYSQVSGHHWDRVPGFIWATALVCGFLASAAIVSFQHGLRFGKISTSWLIINLSMSLPIVLSILIYSEAVSPRRALGLGLAVIALLLLWLERRREERLE